MSEILCLEPKPTQEIECLCFDEKPCNIHINDGGTLVCRHGTNEDVVDGIARIICPLEIASERKKWEAFEIKSEAKKRLQKNASSTSKLLKQRSGT